jgi:hypothetical protein
MAMADRQGAFLHAEAPASVAEDFTVGEAFTAAVAAGIGNRSLVMFRFDRKIWEWRTSICAEQS